MLAELNDFVREDLLDEMEPQQVADIAGQLDTDDAVALIEDLEEDEQRAVLREMEPDERAAIEQALASFCSYEKLNYLMLMIVDPNVHFHVIPRYAGTREWNGLTFADEGRPGPPQLQAARKLEAEQIAALRDALKPLFEGS